MTLFVGVGLWLSFVALRKLKKDVAAMIERVEAEDAARAPRRGSRDDLAER